MSVSLESLMRDPTAEARGGVLSDLLAFLVVGGVGAVGFVLLSSLMIGLRTGVPDWVMSALCYAVMIGPVYLAHRRFSFRSEAPHARALPRYIMVQVTAIVLAALFSFIFYRLLGVPTLGAAVLVTLLTSAVNFVVLRAWAFATHH